MNEAKESFKKIKDVITSSPILVSLKFSKYFIIYSHSLGQVMATILLQKDEANHEQPITFTSKVLKEYKLK